MPRHWEYIKEKDKTVQEILHFDPEKQQFEKAKLVVVSSIIALREAMRLLALQAEQCVNSKDGEDKGLDLANFDCYACHHDLKSPSWRQERGYFGKPGRPQMPPWPTALLRLGLQEVAKREDAVKEVDAGLKRVHEGFSAQPFGDCAKIASAANDLALRLDKLGEALDTPETKYDRETAKRLLQGLCSISDKETPDYDAARQIAWAFEIIYFELEPSEEKDSQSSVGRVIKDLKAYLKLDLPAGKTVSISQQLPRSLQVLNDYEPDQFKKRFRALAPLLTQVK
jgi:hypothetical protein